MCQKQTCDLIQFIVGELRIHRLMVTQRPLGSNNNRVAPSREWEYRFDLRLSLCIMVSKGGQELMGEGGRENGV
jgi:hypothetical protein